MTPHAAALLCQAIYSPSGEFDSICNDGAVVCGRKDADGQIVIAFRGSACLEDFLHDVEGIQPVRVPLIGTIGAGFFEGVRDIFELLGLRAGDDIILTGHSLGCCHAAYVARLCILRGIKVSQLILFEPPRAGYQDFIDSLRNVGQILAYRDREDGVTSVPMTTEDCPWVQFDLIPLNVKPDGFWGDGLLGLADHSITNDVTGTA